jgi:hypothetical protein
MAEQFEEFDVVCAFLANGIDAPEYHLLAEALNQAKPDAFLFIQPQTILACFLSKKDGAGRGDRAVELLNAVKRSNSNLAPLGLGRAKGTMLAEFSWFGFGGLKSMPAGDAVAEAQKRARAAL